MNSRTKKVLVVSMIIGLYIAIEHHFFSGTFPLFINIARVIILLFLIYGIVLITRECERNQKTMQITILLVAVGIGIIGTILISNGMRDDFPRRIYKTQSSIN